MKIGATANHQAFYDDLVKVLSKHARGLKDDELLAVAANMVGKIIGLQNPHRMSFDQAMDIVSKNIELGNQQVMAHLLSAKTGLGMMQ